jgi:hypothetical protein
VANDPINKNDPSGLGDDAPPSLNPLAEYWYILLFMPRRPSREPQTNYPECNPRDSRSVESVLNFVVEHYTDAESIARLVDSSFKTNIDAAVVLGWSGYESSWGKNRNVATNTNYLHQSTGGNWINQIGCGSGANTLWACFGSYEDSVVSAFFSPMYMMGYQSANGPINRPSAGFVIGDQLAQGNGVAAALQQVAGGGTAGGWNRVNTHYGEDAA